MSRNTAAVESASQPGQIRLRIAAHVDSVSTPLRLVTGGNYIYTGTNTYTPIGGMATIDPVQEDTDIFPRAIRVKLAATNSAQVVDLAAENLYNKPVTLYRMVLTDALTVVDTPQLLFKGRINTATYVPNDTQYGSYYEIEVEGRLKQNPKVMYYDRQTLWTILGNSGDTFFDQLVNIPNFIGEWGKAPTNFNVPQPGIIPGGGPGTKPGTRPF
jgi:hypothetical protein